MFFLKINETEKQSPGTQKTWMEFLILAYSEEDLETKYSPAEPNIY